jgi:hypothetical protein
MGVMFAVMGRAKPGRWDDCLRDAAHAGKVYERHGIDKLRFSTTAIAGEADGQWVFSLEFPSGAAYGAAQDRVMADDEMQALLHSTRAADSPVVVESTVLMVELPTQIGPGTTGPVTEAHLSRLNPGGLARALATTEEAFAIARSHGAVGTRLFRMTFAGSMTGLYAVIFEYPDMATFSAGLDKWGSDAKSKALMDGIDAADSPTTLISSAVYTEIPL